MFNENQSHTRPGITRCAAAFNWPAELIKKGYAIIVQVGPVRVGQLVSVVYCKTPCISRLTGRTKAGAITLRGKEGVLHILTSDEYKIEPVIEIRHCTRQSPWRKSV